ncbi:MAG: SDR family oxidoreductase [Hyphomicrobiaceae bacterium]
MTEPLSRPRRKNPLNKTRLPLLPHQGRSRAAHLLTLAAAEGRFALPGCADCGAVHYPPRDACPKCLGGVIVATDVADGGIVLAVTTIRASTDSYFKERMPWRIGTVVLDAGPSLVAHLHGDVSEGQRVRLALHLDKSGQAVVMALPQKDTPHMADDPQLRELTLDPKFRRVLITSGRSTVGQAAARAFSSGGSSIIFVGVAEPWKPSPDVDALKGLAGVELVALDVTNSDSVLELAKDIGAKVDIVVNTVEHVRPGGMIDRHGVALAREELESGLLGLMRLAQAFGPTLRFRAADGKNSACAWVNLLSVYALANWPAYGAYSAGQAAMLSAAHSLRGEFASSGVRVVNVFTGPLDTEWFQTVAPPKVAPTQLAAAIVAALKRGTEDVYVGDIAEDIRSRLAINPKAVERELGSERSS